MPEPGRVSPIVGILGGMGPAATVDFYDRLVRATPAGQDQEHLRVVIWADPTVPNRHAALLEGGTDPTPWLEEGVEHLIGCGAEIIVAPCNTVHAFLPAVMAGRDVEFISIIDAAVDAVNETDAGGRVGVLAADGALAAGLYQSALRAANKEPVTPSEVTQRKLMDAIYAVKAGHIGVPERELVASLLREMRDEGVSTVIAGCTEVSLLLRGLDVDVAVVDPSQVLAFKTVRRARACLE